VPRLGILNLEPNEVSGQCSLRLRWIIQEETWIAAAMIFASNPDRAMTVREWDPMLQLKGYTLI